MQKMNAKLKKAAAGTPEEKACANTNAKPKPNPAKTQDSTPANLPSMRTFISGQS